MRVTTTIALVTLSGCVVDVDGPAPQTGSDAGSSDTFVGLVASPANGAVVPGDPATLSIHVAGLYRDTSSRLAIQVLANPDDLTSWATIATTTATGAASPYAYAVEVRPAARDPLRWPAGGVLRLRVVDSAGVALPVAEDGAITTVAIVNPARPPATWMYLSEKPVGSPTETGAYYQAIGAPATLDGFKTKYGFGPADVAARYYNAGDLGIGRDMHCVAMTAGGVACYVSNYGTFGGNTGDAIDALVAGTTPLATVAMVYTPPVNAPNAVTFMVYGGAGSLVDQAQLDTHGDNISVPQNCLNCHGGRSSYDPTAHAASGARMLPFDPAAFAFASRSDLTFEAQKTAMQQLNQLVKSAEPTASELAVIEGMFPGGTYDPTFVPSAWNGSPSDARVYRDAIAPFCRSCHAGFADGSATFATPDGLRANAAAVVSRICGTGPRGMPAAEATATRFYASSARALLLQWLGVAGACPP